MLVNKKITIIIILSLFVFACKNKKQIQTEEPYVPSRSDYIIAINKAFITACDSAANRTRDAILSKNEEIQIQLDHKNQEYIDLYKSLGDSVKEEIIYTQLRSIVAESVDDIHIECSRYLKILPNDDVKDLIDRNILVRKYVLMRQFQIANEIEQRCKKRFNGSRSDVFLREGKMLYQQYYNTRDSTPVSFAKIARSTSLYFIKELEKQEQIAKKNYRLWDNKQAIRLMNYLEENK
jgi:hypothetical protein